MKPFQNEFEILRSYRIYPLDVRAAGVDYLITTDEAKKAVQRARLYAEKEDSIYVTSGHGDRTIDYAKVFALVQRFYIEKGFLCADLSHWPGVNQAPWEAPPDSLSLRIMGDVDIEGDQLVNLNILHLNFPNDPRETKHSKFMRYRRWWSPTPFI